MNQRERILAGIIVSGLVLTVLYQGVQRGFLRPIAKAEIDVEELTAENRKLDLTIASRSHLAKRWLKYARQTFDFDETRALDRFGFSLKEIAQRHGFEDANFTTSPGTKIGDKTGISTVAHRIGIEGKFSEVVAFMRDVYETPYLCAITKLTVTPMGSRVGRDAVRVEFTVETPVLPEIDKHVVREAANVELMPSESMESLPPAREDLPSKATLALLTDRNLFREYLPPPPNVVMIENNDWKTVAARVTFYWDGRIQEEIVKTIASKSHVSVEGKGDIVEVAGTYADGAGFGPQRLDFGVKQDWTYAVAVHHPPPPPEVIDLAVDNQHADQVFVDVVFTTKDGQHHAEPTMVFGPGRADVREYRDVISVEVSAKYASGAATQPRTFAPKNDKQTYVIVPEVIAQQTEVVEAPPVEDPPADAELTVSGLLMYEGNQEMVAMRGPRQREIIRAGEEGAVDGGVLLAVHPLGGLVRMPTGNYYIYPLGRRFTDRVKLEARGEADLAEAVDAWSRQ